MQAEHLGACEDRASRIEAQTLSGEPKCSLFSYVAPRSESSIPTASHFHWSSDDLRKLVQAKDADKSWPQIAAALGRSVDACLIKYRTLSPTRRKSLLDANPPAVVKAPRGKEFPIGFLLSLSWHCLLVCLSAVTHVRIENNHLFSVRLAYQSKPWTRQEETRMLEYREEGLTFRQIA